MVTTWLASLLLTWAPIPQGSRLNAPFPPDEVGWARDYAVSADGSALVYRADQEQQHVVELYAVPSLGGAPPIRVSGALSALRSVEPGYSVSPDGAWVAFVADKDTDDVRELYGARLDGSAGPIRLNSPLVAGGNVIELDLAPDGGRVVYLADQATDNAFELFSVPVDGSAAPVRLNDPLGANRDVTRFWLSPDGARVLYLADGTVDERFELFSVPIDASQAPVRLNGDLVGGVQSTPDLEPLVVGDSSAVLYVAAEVVGGYGLFRRPLDGSGAPLRLTPALAAGRALTSFRLAPDGSRAAYLADQDVDDQTELFSVPLTGGAPTKLNGTLGAGRDVFQCWISPDSARVVYSANPVSLTELFSRPLDGSGAATKVSGSVTSLFLQPDDERFVPDGSRVVFGTLLELYSAPSDGSSPPVSVSGPLPVSGALIASYRVSPDSQQVALVRYPFGPPSTSAILVAPVDGTSAPVELPQSEDAFEVVDPRVDPSGAWLFYRSTQHVFRVPLDGSSPSERVHPKLAQIPTQSDVFEFRHSPDGRWILFYDGSGSLTDPVLFTVASDGSGAPRTLSGPGGFRQFSSLRFSSDGARAVFLDASSALVSAPTDASAAPLQLSPPGAKVGLDPRLSPDDARVAFVVLVDDELQELRSAPVDGSAPSVLLATLTGSFDSVVFSPDSSQVFYSTVALDTQAVTLRVVPSDGSTSGLTLATPVAGGRASIVGTDGQRLVFHSAVTSGVAEVFSVPCDGSAAPVRLNAIPVAGGDVTDVALTPDATRVVYRADQNVDERFELFSALAGGSAAPVRLNAALSAAQDVLANSPNPSFRVAPDGARVVFRAGPPFELYSVPTDGSASPIALSTGVPGTGSPAAFEISPDGQRVVFLFNNNGTLQLHSIPIDGSAPVVMLHPPVGPGTVFSFRVAPSSSAVAFAAGQNQHAELYLSPIDGSAAPRRISAALGALQRVTVYELHPSEERVVYLADQAVNEQYELWLRYIARVPRPAATPTVTRTR